MTPTDMFWNANYFFGSFIACSSVWAKALRRRCTLTYNCLLSTHCDSNRVVSYHIFFHLCPTFLCFSLILSRLSSSALEAALVVSLSFLLVINFLMSFLLALLGDPSSSSSWSSSESSSPFFFLFLFFYKSNLY